MSAPLTSTSAQKQGGQTTYTLSSMPPLGSFMGTEPVTMITGYEPQDDGTVKVYLGARHKGLYLLVTDPEEQEFFERGWNSIMNGHHCWMWPLPPADAIHCDVPVVSDGTRYCGPPLFVTAGGP
jgi:hypothetical protein